MIDDIQFLVNETLKHHEENYNQKPVQNSSWPEISGIVYKIEDKVSSFLVRTHISQNLAEDKELIEQMPSSFSSLKLENEGDLSFYSCRAQEAIHIQKQTMNRRFTKGEDNFSLMGDLNEYWWFVKERNEIKIYFNNKIRSDVTNLGPLYSVDETKNILPICYKYFSEQFSLHFSQNDYGFSLSGDEYFLKSWTHLFLEGEISEEIREVFISKLISIEHRQVSLFFQKVAAAREFWNKLQFD